MIVFMIKHLKYVMHFCLCKT